MRISNTTLMTKSSHDPRYVPPEYDPGDFKRPSLTTDAIIFTVEMGVLETLLVQRGKHPYKDYWALPGGFANPGERVQDSCLRELEEETNLTGINPYLLGVYDTPGRDPRTWVASVAYYAIIPWDAVQMKGIKAGDDARNAGWAVAYEDKLPPLAFDHAVMLADAVKDIRQKSMISSILWPLLAKVADDSTLAPQSFTKEKLLEVYRAVHNTPWTEAELYDRLRSRGVICRTDNGNLEFVIN